MLKSESESNFKRHVGWYGWGLAAIFCVVFVSILEIYLVDRKYGVFSGGFGVSRIVDSDSELLTFMWAFFSGQIFVAILVWWLVRVILGGRLGWIVVWYFLILFAGGIFVWLGVQYKLHSYFSDAVSFALLKQLAGGSFLDSLKYGAEEGVIPVIFGGLTLGCLWMFDRRVRLRMSAAFVAIPHALFRWALLFSVVNLIAISLWVTRAGDDSYYALTRTVIFGNLVDLLNEASDFDGDGFGLFSAQFDPRPFDPGVHPMALDIPGDGIDQDGFGGDLSDGPIVLGSGPFPAPSSPMNLVIVVIESARGDAVGKVIDGNPVTPHLSSLAGSGSHFPAFSHVGFTVESLKSLFSGSLVIGNNQSSIFSDLRRNGYRIGVFSGQPEDFGGISEAVKMRESSDVFVDAESLRDKRAFGFAAQASLLVDESHIFSEFERAFGDRRAWSQPVFLYFNFQSPHFPYHHDGVESRLIEEPISRSEIRPENKARLEATYWNAVAHSDFWLGEVIKKLQSLGVWNNTLLVVTGDHGEELFEDGFLGHGHIINFKQNQTFLVSNRVLHVGEGALALSDYRQVIAQAMGSIESVESPPAPFMYIGSLDRAVQIGIRERSGEVVTLRTDTRVACFVRIKRCSVYDHLASSDKTRVDALVTRWGRERWHRR